MKTDKELLELAAKAAGITGEWVEDFNPTHDYFYSGSRDGFYFDETGNGDFRVWNPLTDGGDALRLAVFLDMCVYVNRVDEVVSAQAGYYGEHKFYENFYDDMYAATCRAIVRAAAAIGELL